MTEIGQMMCVAVALGKVNTLVLTDVHEQMHDCTEVLIKHAATDTVTGG